MRNSAVRRAFICAPLLALSIIGQQTSDVPLEAAARDAAIDALASKIDAGYVVPETADLAAQFLRKAKEDQSYQAFTTARAFAEKITTDLRAVTKDKHLALYFAWLGALADFDSIILDLRQNGGGNTPMAAYVASYFLGPKPVLFTSMHWRDENRTVDVMTSETVGGRRSLDRDLFILVGPSTFSAAEDFSYSLQRLKRATLVGETTGGGAHMGRGLQRLSPLFTAFIPVGESMNPITRKNWEGTGVEPDVRVPVDGALAEAHMLALRKLLDRERDPAWRENLVRTIADLETGK